MTSYMTYMIISLYKRCPNFAGVCSEILKCDMSGMRATEQYFSVSLNFEFLAAGSVLFQSFFYKIVVHGRACHLGIRRS